MFILSYIITKHPVPTQIISEMYIGPTHCGPENPRIKEKAN